MNEENLIKYYNKFNEDKRLNSRHGQVEFITSLKYIHEYLEEMEKPKILDIGAGCGRYSIELANEGYDVTAIELVKHNLRVIEQKSDKVKAYQGNALDLSRFKSNSFDLVLLFGPMYHLCNEKDKIKVIINSLFPEPVVPAINPCGPLPFSDKSSINGSLFVSMPITASKLSLFF